MINWKIFFEPFSKSTPPKKMDEQFFYNPYEKKKAALTIHISVDALDVAEALARLAGELIKCTSTYREMEKGFKLCQQKLGKN